MAVPITEHVHRTTRHTTFYLAAGPSDGAAVILLHGWPELSISWRHQLACLGGLGFRAIAPDLRGYGRSSVYGRHEDYALEHAMADIIELLDGLGRRQAVWVGHDWGAPLAWSLASHHPDRSVAVACLCVPYVPEGFTPANLIALVDRAVYPESEFPAGQWDYQLFYEESFERALVEQEADVQATVKALFRAGNPDGKQKPGRLSTVRRDGGWFGGGGRAPDLPLDTKVLGEVELDAYVAALTRNGFFGPNSWYMNASRNAALAAASPDGGRLTLPALFLHGEYDYTCETVESRLAEPMRRACSDLTEAVVRSGHWMAQEKPVEVNAALVSWLAARFPELWRVSRPATG